VATYRRREPYTPAPGNPSGLRTAPSGQETRIDRRRRSAYIRAPMGRTTQWLLVALLLVGLFAAQHYYRFRSFFGPKLEYVAGASEPPKSPGAELSRPPEWREHPDIILIRVDTRCAQNLSGQKSPCA
jgi:hypothetical protein